MTCTRCDGPLSDCDHMVDQQPHCDTCCPQCNPPITMPHPFILEGLQPIRLGEQFHLSVREYVNACAVVLTEAAETIEGDPLAGELEKLATAVHEWLWLWDADHPEPGVDMNEAF